MQFRHQSFLGRPGLPLGHSREASSWRATLACLCGELGVCLVETLYGCAYCHGRFVRCGETSTQLPLSRLKRLWEISFKTGSVMAGRFLPLQNAGVSRSGFTGLYGYRYEIYMSVQDGRRGECSLAVERCTLTDQAFPAGGTLARSGIAPSPTLAGSLRVDVEDSRASPSNPRYLPDWRSSPQTATAGFCTENMAAMMPSSATSGNPYDDDAVERDLIDPDDGALHAAVTCPPPPYGHRHYRW